MTLATGIGSMPGTDTRDYDEAVRVVLGELPDLCFLPELPGRGATASMTGRALAIVAELGADLQPAGWRLTGASGIDQRRARSLLAQDLDTMEEQSQGFSAAMKLQVCGPWTLAATVELPRGEKVLSDPGARRELAQALAEGLRAHVAECRRRFPLATRLLVQVDEPALSAVLAGQVPTASGYGRHRTIDLPEASDLLHTVLAAIEDSGAEPWTHSCAAGTPWGLILGAGSRGVCVDLGQLDAGAYDDLAAALEGGRSVGLGVVASTRPAVELTSVHVAERVLRWLDLLGLDPESLGGQLVLTPTCGLAGADRGWGPEALRLCREAAAHLITG